MLNEFESWFGKNITLVGNRDWTVTISRTTETTDKPSIRADVDSSEVLGRATLWASGELETEAVEVETEATKFNRYVRVNSVRELYEGLEAFLKQLSTK